MNTRKFQIARVSIQQRKAKRDYDNNNNKHHLIRSIQYTMVIHLPESSLNSSQRLPAVVTLRLLLSSDTDEETLDSSEEDSSEDDSFAAQNRDILVDVL